MANLASVIRAGDRKRVPAGYADLSYGSVLSQFGAPSTVTSAGGPMLQQIVEGKAQVKEVELASTVDASGFVQDAALKQVVMRLQPKWGIPLTDKGGNLYFATGGDEPARENAGRIGLTGRQACPATLTDADAFKGGAAYAVGVSFDITAVGREYLQHFYPDADIGCTGSSGMKDDLYRMMEAGQLWAEIAVINGSSAKVFHAKVVSSESSAGVSADKVLFVTSPLLGVSELRSALPAAAGGLAIGDEGARFPFADGGHDFMEAKINGFDGSSLEPLVKEGRVAANVKVTFPKELTARVRLWASKDTGGSQSLPDEFYKTTYGDPREGLYDIAGAAAAAAGLPAGAAGDVTLDTSTLSGSIGQKIAAAARLINTFMTVNAYIYSQAPVRKEHWGKCRDGYIIDSCRNIAPVDSWTSGNAAKVAAAARAAGLKFCNNDWGIDCSGFVTWCLCEAGAMPCTGKIYADASGNYKAMSVKLNAGLSWRSVTLSELQPGDVLWRQGHVGLVYDGSHQIDFGLARWMTDSLSKVPSQWTSLKKAENPHSISGYTAAFRVVGG